MKQHKRKQLDELMTRINAGDQSAMWVLVREFDDELSKTVRYHLRRLGRTDLLNDSDFVSGIAMDIGLIFLGTKAWEPGGALPWVWARLAIAQLVGASAGHRAVEIEDHHLEAVPSYNAGSVEADVGLDELAEQDEVVKKLCQALALVGSDRDQKVHIDYRIQIADGDPSPSHTVAESHGLSPTNVRQIDRRIRVKIKRLAAQEASYSVLEDLRWLA